MQLQQIAERCQQGDREAFAMLYTAMRKPLRAVCLGYVHDESVADDLLHDAFLLVFYQIGKLKDTARTEAWMTMVMRRVALLYLRKQRRQCLKTLSSSAETPLHSLTVENRAESALAVQDILAAVDALPEGYRNVFRLFMLEGMTHQEIAAMLNIEPHSSSSQLVHAKALLRRWLRPIVVLLLLAVAQPMGIWHWHNSLEKTDTKPTPVVAKEENICPSPVGNLACLIPPDTVSDEQQPLQVTELDKLDPLQVAELDKLDSLHVADSDEQKTVRTDSCQMLLPTDKKGSDRLLAVTNGSTDVLVRISGTGHDCDIRLPYANAETNPIVYDSVAHHHRPLIVSLMLNRKLDDHWQVGAGLSYQRLTSDMLSGNTYVMRSQHQVVQYLGLPVSVSWHYPLSQRFSTYLSASASVSLPLSSTLESVYIMNGQAYEPMTERLRPAVQLSLGTGIGLQYNLTPRAGLFAEPGLYYHFNVSDDNVKTWNTEHPFGLSVPFGLRITF